MKINEATLNDLERPIYHHALEMLEREMDASTFSARFFGPEGELSRLGTSREERRHLLGSDLYRWLKAEYTELRRKDAARFERDLKSVSGRLSVVVPKSLHAALKDEAVSEGVSLSELIRLKLTIPYRQMTDLLAPKPLSHAVASRARS